MIELKGVTTLVQVFNMRASLAFYRDILGFEIVQSSGTPADDAGWVWLRLGGADLMLNTQYDEGEAPAAPDVLRTKWHEDTCMYFNCPDVDGTYAFLKDRWPQIEAPSNAPYGARQLYVTDPDGYRLCFQWSV